MFLIMRELGKFLRACRKCHVSLPIRRRVHRSERTVIKRLNIAYFVPACDPLRRLSLESGASWTCRGIRHVRKPFTQITLGRNVRKGPARPRAACQRCLGTGRAVSGWLRKVGNVQPGAFQADADHQSLFPAPKLSVASFTGENAASPPPRSVERHALRIDPDNVLDQHTHRPLAAGRRRTSNAPARRNRPA